MSLVKNKIMSSVKKEPDSSGQQYSWSSDCESQFLKRIFSIFGKTEVLLMQQLH